MKKLLLFVGFAIVCTAAFAQTLPQFFSMTDVSSGSTWNAPVGAVFNKAGDRLFVWEKDGRVYVCNRQGTNYVKQATAVLNISDEVGSWRDFGLLGFALDPNFEVNGYIYGLYVVDRHHLMTGGLAANGYNAATNEYFNATIGRVTRFTTSVSGGNLIANPASRKVLLGESKSTGIPILHESHGVGSLGFAADGTLLITCGDGASYNIEDGGSISHTYYSQALTDGIIRTQENVGAFRAQMLNSHNGKLLRIDPETGNGVSSNPFYDASAPRSAKSRVWALGFRNPFRMFVKPGTGSTNPAAGDIGEVFVGEVGWNLWEEQNVVKAAGTNFGWPLYEGQTVQTGYMAFETQNADEPNPFGSCSGRANFRFKDLLRQDNADNNKSVFNPCNASQLIGTHNRYIHARPSLDWRHGQNIARVPKFDAAGAATNPTIGTAESQTTGTPFGGNCSAGGIWYTGTGNTFPAEYKNTFIAADYGGTWIRRLSMDFTDVVTRVDNFATNVGNVVCMAENPIDGSIVCVNVGSSTVKKISFGGNIPPVAKITADNYYTAATSLTANFSGTGSTDQDGNVASYAWNFGDPTSGSNTSTSATPSHLFTTTTGPKKFIVTLTVTDNGGAVSATEQFIVSVNNTPPVVNITSPVKNSLYVVGRPDSLYSCTATVTDAQHTAGQLTYEWQTFLRHNNHQHAEAIDNKVNTSTIISRIGCTDEYYWLIKLTVTDAAGLSTSDSSKIFPDCGPAPDNTAPVVSTVSPLNGATGVATGTTITANFNEAINAATLTGTTVQLKNGAAVIAANLNISSTQVILTPTAALANSILYTVIIKGGSSGVKDISNNPLASDYNWTFTTAAAADNTPPTVSSVSPANGTTGVSVTTAVSAIFSEAMNAASISSSTIELRNPSNVLIAGTVSYNAATRTATIIPSTALSNSTIYTVKIISGSLGVKDVANNPLATDYTWSFTTGNVIVQSPVTIQSFDTKTGINPTVHVLTAVPAGALLVLATTSDAFPADCIVSSIPALTWTKRSDAGAASSDNAEIWTAVFAAGGTINVTSSWGGEHSQASVCYVVLNAETTLGGASAIGVLQASPSVTLTTTKENSVIFGCTADWKAVNGATRTLRDAATERLYFRDGNYTTYHYTKVATAIAAYTEGVSLPTGQQASTALLEIRSGVATPDIISPTVTSVSPSNGATGIAVSTTMSAIFNEAMDATTINSSTIELRNASAALVAAAVSYNAATRTVTISPSAALATATGYTITIKSGASGVKDLAANPLAVDYNSSFTTVVPDIIPPTVSAVTPVNGSIDLALNATASAIFNETMNAATINSSTIELRNTATTLITATVSYNAGTRTATITPSAALANSTVYTVTIKAGAAGVKDAAENPLANDYSWSFTTVAADLTSPVVSSVTPVNAATDVSVSTTVSAIFNEAIDATTINIPNIELRNSSNTLITAVVSYNAATRTATLVPSATLANSTLYTATIKGGVTGVKDIAGNTLTADYSWSFTTGTAVIQPPVTIQSVSTKTGIAATTHSLTGVPAGALLVLATTSDAFVADCIVSSSPVLTWTKRSDAGATSSDNAEIWTAVYTAGGTISVTSNWSSEHSQASVLYVVLNAEPVLGGASAIAVSQAAPSVTITTTRTNSIIFGCTADWRAINGATRTLRDAATERLYFRDGHYTTYYYTKAAASIAAYTEGVSLPAGQQASTALLEIRSAGAVATRPANTTITIAPSSITDVHSHSLGQNYPNPFDKDTRIPFALSKAEKVNLVVFDISGRIVKVLVNASRDKGAHLVNFNAGTLASGIYYYRIQAGDFSDVKKLVIW